MITEQDLLDAPPVILTTGELIDLSNSEFRPRFSPGDDGYWEVLLQIEVPLGITDNACHRYRKGGGSYASPEYKAWLDHCAPLLQELLGAWQPDTSRWWSVHLDLWIGNTDGPNHLKALLDLLSGARVVTEAFNAKNGKRIGKGSVWHYGGLWDDDRRVKAVTVTVHAVKHPTPYAQITAWETPAPVDYRAQQEAQERQRRVKAKLDALIAKDEARQAERDRKAQAKREDEQARTVMTTCQIWGEWVTRPSTAVVPAARSRVRKAVAGKHLGEFVSITFTPGEWAKLTKGSTE
jgi:hypothetical protein